MAKEKNFENRVKTYLKNYGAYGVKYFSNGFTKVGIPDLLYCIDGIFYGIEVKADNGKPSPLQIQNLIEIHNAGGCGILLYPEYFELFKKYVETQDESYYEDLRKEVLKWQKKLKI